jgi:hypothetical protein
MVAGDFQVFTTEQVTRLVGLKPKDKWRVIKFAEGAEYGIAPSVTKASGSGTRRLYGLEDVCQIALALRLLETGLRSMAIGKVIRQLRDNEKLSARLDKNSRDLLLAIIRAPKIGMPLDEKRDQVVEWVSGVEEAERFRKKSGPDRDLILIPVGLLLAELGKRLGEFQSDQAREK